MCGGGGGIPLVSDVMEVGSNILGGAADAATGVIDSTVTPVMEGVVAPIADTVGEGVITPVGDASGGAVQYGIDSGIIPALAFAAVTGIPTDFTVANGGGGSAAGTIGASSGAAGTTTGGMAEALEAGGMTGGGAPFYVAPGSATGGALTAGTTAGSSALADYGYQTGLADTPLADMAGGVLSKAKDIGKVVQAVGGTVGALNTLGVQTPVDDAARTVNQISNVSSAGQNLYNSAGALSGGNVDTNYDYSHLDGMTLEELQNAASTDPSAMALLNSGIELPETGNVLGALQSAAAGGDMGALGALQGIGNAQDQSTWPQYLQSAQNAVKAGASLSNTIQSLLKLGVPAAMAYGIASDAPQSPLVAPMTQAAYGALGAAQQFSALPAIQTTPSQQRSIDLANANVGTWQPDINQARTLTTSSAQGVSPEQIATYTNPYLQDVLNPAIRDIEDAAARRREEMRAVASRSGNDFASGPVTRYQVESDLLDRSMGREIGTLSANTRANAYNNATGLATQELQRQANAGGALQNIASGAATLGLKDQAALESAGELERQRQEEERKKLADTASMYTGVIHGTAPVVAPTTPQDKLSQTIGALGTYNQMTKPGGLLA